MNVNNYYVKLCTALVVLLLAAGATFAQRTVTGTVTDAETKEAISGVTVLVKGTTSGAFTDENGKFTVAIPEGATTLEFRFFGYATTEVEVGDRTTVDVSLTPEISTLEEVVVTGYGTQKQKEVTSSIVSVKAEDFNQGNVNNVAQLLQGKVAGLSIYRPGGDPNRGFNIRLRGLSSLGGNTEPLVVIDGVIGADLNSIDPNDIASIDVLKDGSAAAIYGTRGSSGVLIITTKKGEAGSSVVNYNGYVTAEQVARVVDVMSASEFRELVSQG
ncbi:MAG: SusC/RagA family TonB-linked outer membrane protein, partial [Bacteroidetes bacterium]